MASSFSRTPSATCATSHFSGNYRAERDRTRELGEKDRQRSGSFLGCENAETSGPCTNPRSVTRTVKLAVDIHPRWV